MEKVKENDSSEQCRICLESAQAMLNLFEDPKTPYKLELCCGVQIVNIPSLPSKICKKCSDILNVAYGFRVLCQRSHEYLSENHNILPEDDDKFQALENLYVPQEYLSDNHKVQPEDDANKCQALENPYKPLLKSEYESEYLEDDEQKYNDEEDETHVNYESAPEEQEEQIVDQEELIVNQEQLVVEQQEQFVEQDEHEDNKTVIDKTFSQRQPRKPKSPVTYMCSICANLFRNKATFNYHMKLHQNDKKYECEICSKRFMQTCELRAHIRVHTGEKPYGCKYCDRKFRDRSGVTRHERTHTNERPYGCPICGAHFSYSATLKKHERVHTGEKPFKCKICDKGFSESHQMKAHLTTIRHAEMAKEKSKMNILP